MSNLIMNKLCNHAKASNSLVLLGQVTANRTVVFAEIYGYKIRTIRSIVQRGAVAYSCIAVIKIFFACDGWL